MITGKEDLLESIIEVYLMEKGTQEFYLEASHKAINPEAKKMFSELSEWENKHMEYIQFLYQSIRGDQEIRSFEEFKNRVDAPLTEGGIPVKELENKLEKYTITDEIGAITLAMEIEGKAYNLYRSLSQTAEDKNAQTVFGEMMEQEVKHVNYLKSMRVKTANIYTTNKGDTMI